MVFGIRPPLQDPNLTYQCKLYDTHAQLIKSLMMELHSNAIAIQSINQDRSKKYFERKRRANLFQEGDSVFIKTPPRTSKLHNTYTGPHTVVSMNNDIVKLTDQKTNRFTTRHVSDIRHSNYSTMGTLLSIIMLCTLATACSADVLFNKVKPIIWMSTKSVVSP